MSAWTSSPCREVAYRCESEPALKVVTVKFMNARVVAACLGDHHQPEPRIGCRLGKFRFRDDELHQFARHALDLNMPFGLSLNGVQVIANSLSFPRFYLEAASLESFRYLPNCLDHLAVPPRFAKRCTPA